MRTAEDSSGTVLHRLIQEQLRFGNLTDTRALLAIQQQALRGGSSGGGGVGSPRSSLESLTQEETQYIHMSARQEPQGQEHQGDCLLSERSACDLYGLHSEELPTYEEAKALSQYLNSQKVRTEQRRTSADTMAAHVEGQWDLKREHARSLSDRLMQLSLDRNGDRDNLSQSFSRSYPQLYNGTAVPYHNHGGQQFLDPRGPPPDYPVFARLPEYALSHSQEHGQYYGDPPPPLYSQHHRYVSAQSQVALSGVTAASSVVPAPDVLMRENEKLRKELELFTEKATRMQKMESEIQRISEEYETLMRGSAKRETLEKTMRNKLESEIKRMHDFNRDLREQLDTATKQQAAREADQKQNIFVKLLEQKAEQQREREQLERKVQHLRVAGDECRQRRTLLEQKLASAQLRNLQLEEDLQKKTAYIAKVERMQSALAQLQAACEKREVLEQRLRTRLEQELKSLRAQQKQGADPTATASSSFALQQQLREKEECILALEADITKWEQKYLEESTMRQFAMDAAATAAAQRDTTIIKHSPRHSPNSSFNDSLPSHRHQEMKNRIRALHAQLLEKDAVIKVFQQRSRWEQGRSENQGLRLARSVPSINTTACTGTQLKGKSLSDDLTGASAATAATLSSQPCTMLKVSNRDVSTQSDEVTQAPPLRAEPGGKKTSESVSAGVTDPVEDPAVPPKTLKSIKSSDAEMVEILI